jgi:AhpD family alkylhydroperoxidase
MSRDCFFARPNRAQVKRSERMDKEGKDKIQKIVEDRTNANEYFERKSEAYRAFQELERKAFQSKSLQKGVKELIALGISIVTKCEPCMEWHVRQALKDGMTEEQIVETMEVAFEMGGGPATVQARFALSAMDHYLKAK